QLRPPRLPSLPRRPAHVRGRQAGGAGIAGGAEGLHPALQRRAPGRRDPIRLRRNAAPELLGPGDDLETYGELSSGRSMQTLGSRGYVGRPNSVQCRYNGARERKCARAPARQTKGHAMAKAYWIATYRSISNPDALAAYAKLAGPAIEAGGGRFLARGLPAQVYEAGVKERTVLIEFDSV